MKFRSLLLTALAASFLLACVPDDLIQEETLETPAGEYSAALFETGHVRIFVDAETAAKLELTGTP